MADFVHLDVHDAHVHVNTSTDLFLYRLVYERNYLNAFGLRHYAVILEYSAGVHCEGELSCVWFAVVHALFAVEQIAKENNRDTVLASNYFAFVQCLEVCNSANNVDIATRFFRLQYSPSVSTEQEVSSAPSSFDHQTLDPGNWLSMKPIESVISMSPLVPADQYFPATTCITTRRVQHGSFHAGIRGLNTIVCQ